MRIGYVGLGAMGGAIARRLLLRYDLEVFDLDESAVQALVSLGASQGQSLSELGSNCDVVLVCLPTSEHVRSAVLGAGGVAASLAPGAVIIDQTSGDPLATRAMAAQLAQQSVTLVDAPVSGGARGAEAGTLAIMVGATADVFDSVRPILEAISANVTLAGDVGAGHIMKLVNNLLSTTQRVLTWEALALAEKNGVDPKTAVEILVAGGGNNAYLEKIMGPLVLNGELDAGFTLGLAHKDVGLACQLGVDSGVPTPYGNLTREIYESFINELGATAKVDRAAVIVDRVSGSHVVPIKGETE